MNKSISRQFKEALESREKERNKLFDMMLAKKNKKAVAEQFKKFEKAHNKALRRYKNVA